MRKAKGMLAGLLAAGLLGTLVAGCGSTGADSTAQSGGAADEPKRVAVIFTGRYDFFSDMETAQREAAEQAGLAVDFLESKDDISTQLQQVETCVNGGYDGLIVNLVSTDSVQEIIDKAGGLPIVFVNRLPAESVLETGKYVYVGSDEAEAGTLQAQYLTERFVGQENVRVVLMMGTLGLENTLGRTDGLRQGLEAAGVNVQYVFEDTGEYDRAKAMDKMQQFLGMGVDFDAVVANNDDMALGCLEAMQAAGMTDKVVVGIDANKEALLKISQGDMTASVFQDAAGQGVGSIEAIAAILNGEAVDTLNIIPFQLVTQDNAQEFIQ